MLPTLSNTTLSPSAGNGTMTLMPSVFGNSTNSSLAPSFAPSNSTNSSDLVNATTAPSVQIIASPTDSPVSTVQRIRVADFYLAYVAGNADREPTEDEYAQVASLTMDYFETFLQARYADDPDVTYLGIEPALEFTLYGENAGIPNERFNIYMDYSYADVIYTPESTPPNPAETFVILRDSISPEYILDYVRAASGTPFVSTNEVVFRASTMDSPDDRSVQRGPRAGESTNSAPVAALAVSSAAAFLFLVAGIVLYRKRANNDNLYPKDYSDGLYAMDSKMIEGYFSENSVTEMSESQYSSRFPPLQRVAEEGNTTDEDLSQRQAPYRD